MLLVVLAGLILWNEFARRTKMGGAITFFVISVLLTIYFVAIAIGARSEAEWAVNNQTPVLPMQYPDGVETVKQLYDVAGGEAAAVGTTVDTVAANPTMMTVISALALVTNIIAFGYIMYTAKKRHINPYKEDVFVNQKYYKDAMARADVD